MLVEGAGVSDLALTTGDGAIDEGGGVDEDGSSCSCPSPFGIGEADFKDGDDEDASRFTWKFKRPLSDRTLLLSPSQLSDLMLRFSTLRFSVLVFTDMVMMVVESC